MAERVCEMIPPRTERYAEVMAEAAKRAMARANDTREKSALVTMSDVFEALCLVHPKAFSKLLMQPIALPQVTQVEYVNRPMVTLHASEVDHYLSPYGDIIEQVSNHCSEVSSEIAMDSLHIAAALLMFPIPEVVNCLTVSGVTKDKINSLVVESLHREAILEVEAKRKNNLTTTFESVIKIRKYLIENSFGQEDAIRTIITQLSTFWGMPAGSRGAKPLSFFFVGAPGTGKNHLASLLQDAFESFLGIAKVPTIDMARFAVEQLALDLIGRDSSWKDGGRQGALTKASEDNPQGILVIENIELGHAQSISYLDSVLETGKAEDALTKKQVNFSRNVFVVITHKKEFAESEEFLQLVSKANGNPPRDKIIEGLVKYEPQFHSTLRLVDAPILFRKHEFKSFFAIVEKKLSALVQRFEDMYDAKCEFVSEDLYRLLTEMHPSISSAHPVESSLETVILLPLQDWILMHYKEYEVRKKLRIECDTLPDFEGAPKRSDFSTFAKWLEARTKRRLLLAKRLVFTQEVGVTDDAVVLHIKNIAYTMMPSIEDAGYFSVTVPDVSFADLVGVEVVQERVSEVIEYFNHPGSGRVRPDTGLVLYGPPGTGKTSIAKAIAHELGVPFIMVMGADFMKPHVGEGVESVKKLFAVARRYSAVLFIDEIDGIGSRSNETGEGARVINAFLTELDGFHERNMLVIGATNRYEALDEALVRPGRLSLKIQLGLLHRSEDRRRLIEGALDKAQTVISSELVEKLIETTNSWSPANLIAMVNGGIRLARREGKEITFAHFAKARTVVMLGEDPQHQEGAAHEIHLTAVHEAGHAVTAILRGIPFVQVTIQGVGAVAGFCEHLGMNGFSGMDDIERRIDMCLGGRAAEELLAEPTDGVQSDFEHATLLVARMIRLGLVRGNILSVAGETEKEFTIRYCAEIESILQERMQKVQGLLLAHRAFLEAVANALETQKMLFEADVVAIRKNVETKA